MYHYLLKKSYGIENIDSTLILQKPKIAPYIPDMRENIASATGLAIEYVSVKATTTEELGYTGRGEGVAAHAVVLIRQER